MSLLPGSFREFRCLECCITYWHYVSNLKARASLLSSYKKKVKLPRYLPRRHWGQVEVPLYPYSTSAVTSATPPAALCQRFYSYAGLHYNKCLVAAYCVYCLSTLKQIWVEFWYYLFMYLFYGLIQDAVSSSDQYISKFFFKRSVILRISFPKLS